MSSYQFVVAPLRAVGEVVSPFCIRTALALKELIGLAYAKSRREPERIVRVVVVDCAVGVHIHEIVGVARIRGTEPPISGEAGIRPKSKRGGSGLSAFVAPLDFGNLRDFVGNHTDPLF